MTKQQPNSNRKAPKTHRTRGETEDAASQRDELVLKHAEGIDKYGPAFGAYLLGTPANRLKPSKLIPTFETCFVAESSDWSAAYTAVAYILGLRNGLKIKKERSEVSDSDLLKVVNNSDELYELIEERYAIVGYGQGCYIFDHVIISDQIDS